jgi:hypothetical protein
MMPERRMCAVEPGIDCARLPREAMFSALPRKVHTMLPRAAERTLPRANLARVEPNRSGSSFPRQRDFSVLCSFIETVLWRSGVSFAASINGLTRLPRFDALQEHRY